MPGEELAGPTGTPAFAAPEQLLGEPQGASVDCFAVAAIVAFVLTGNPPFGEGETAQILARELTGIADTSAFSPPMAEWLVRGLAIKPEDRFADAGGRKSAGRGAVREARGGGRG